MKLVIFSFRPLQFRALFVFSGLFFIKTAVSAAGCNTKTYLISTFLCDLFFYSLKIRFQIGSSQCTQSSNIYEEFEKRHAFYTSLLVRSGILVEFFCFFISGLVPLSYALFGFPTSDEWILPLDFRWAQKRFQWSNQKKTPVLFTKFPPHLY